MGQASAACFHSGQTVPVWLYHCCGGLCPSRLRSQLQHHGTAGEQDGLRHHSTWLPIGWTDIKVCLLQVKRFYISLENSFDRQKMHQITSALITFIFITSSWELKTFNMNDEYFQKWLMFSKHFTLHFNINQLHLALALAQLPGF